MASPPALKMPTMRIGRKKFEKKHIELVLDKLHPVQQKIRDEARRFNVLSCGRRFGKTTFFEDLIAEIVLPDAATAAKWKGWRVEGAQKLNVQTEMVGDGTGGWAMQSIEGGPVGYFAPSNKLLVEAWDEVHRRFEAVLTSSNEQLRRMEFVTGGVLEMWSFESDEVARSRRYARVLVDEAGCVPRLLKRWEREIRPTLIDLKGDAWMAGTPKGMNDFYEMFRRGQSDDEKWSRWRSWQYGSGANPWLDPEELADLKEELTELAVRQEINAEFIEDGAGVFRGVRRAAVGRPGEPAKDGRAYVAGVDWGRSNDYTVFSVWDAVHGKQVALDRFSETGYEAQMGRLQSVCEAWGVRSALVEANSMGGPLVERAQALGLPVVGFYTTNASKAQIIERMALGFERGQIELLDDETQRLEFEAFQSGRTPSGMVKYEAPDGMHDDCVMAGALGWEACRAYRGDVGVVETVKVETADEAFARACAEWTGEDQNSDFVECGW